MPRRRVRPPALAEHHYAAVAQHWIDHGGQVDFRSGKDQPVADAIVETLVNGAAEHAVVLAGNTSLEQVVDLLGHHRGGQQRFGLMYIAAALKRRPGRVRLHLPGFYPPLGDRVAEDGRAGMQLLFRTECPLGHELSAPVATSR